MKKQIFTTTDLGGGDGGKGGVVHALCVKKKPHTVLKVGGAQGSHGVKTSRGESFAFSQFGCGTFEGIATHISDRMIISPTTLLYEARLLRYEQGIHNIYDILTVDKNCLCALPYHGIVSRIHELAAQEGQRGTVGVGIGEAFLESETSPEIALYVRDLGASDIRDKIEAIRQAQIKKIEAILENTEEHILPEDMELFMEDQQLLYADAMFEWIIEQLTEFCKLVRVVDASYLSDTLFAKDGVMVVESSHGVLTDREYGFRPHVSRLRTLPFRTLSLLEEHGYDGEVIKLGISRAYQIRHGAGPLVTHDPNLLEKLLPGSSKDKNRWQGQVRVGPIDFVALRYSIDVCGGPSAFDALAITWCDQILRNKEWQSCSAYQGELDPRFFSEDGSTIRVWDERNSGYSQADYQQDLTRKLFGVEPVVDSASITSDQCTREYMGAVLSDLFQDELKVLVRLMSFGPTEKEKVFQ